MPRAAGDGVLRRRGVHTAERSVVGGALLNFALLSLVAVIIVTLATFLVAERVARSIALDSARNQAAGVATRLAAPLVDEEVRSGAPAAADQLTTVMTNRLRDGSIRHVKLWDEDGRVIWSDQPELIGRVFDLSPEVSALFGTEDVVAEISDLSREENVAERGEGELLEVYVGAVDRDGVPLVFEAYIPTSVMDENADTLVTSFVWVIVGSLVVFFLLVLPLAVSLSRRVARAQQERATMMRHALLASELERRRIAEDLHHGVVQELAGLGYTLPAVRRHLDKGNAADGELATAQSLLDRSTRLVQRNITALRSLMTDIYPPDLHGEGLRYAVQQLAQTEGDRAGLEVRVEVDEHLEVPPEAGSLAYRIVREGVRNVVTHAEARELRVELASDGTDIRVAVLDDGRGPGEHPGQSPDGHLGLRLLTDAVHDVGGHLEVQPRAEGGTALVARFPLVPVSA
jgi:signal transduction histidine kinase